MYQANFKNYCLLTLAVLLLSCTQNPTPSSNYTRVLAHEGTLPYEPSKPTGKKRELIAIKNIQERYRVIIAAYKNNQLDSVSFKYSCNGEKVGTVSYFSEKGYLKLIKHSYAEYDHHEMEDHYFIENNVPFFAYLKSLSWSFETGTAGATKDVISEKRIYLLAGKPIDCLQKSYEIRLHAGVNPDPDKVPNQKVACASFKSLEKPCHQLMKYWKTPPPKCLEI